MEVVPKLLGSYASKYFRHRFSFPAGNFTLIFFQGVKVWKKFDIKEKCSPKELKNGCHIMMTITNIALIQVPLSIYLSIYPCKI